MRVHIPIRAGGDTHLVPEGSTRMGDVFKADDVSDLRDWPLPGTNRPKLAAGARDRLAPRETNGAGEAAAESVIVEVFLTDANGLSRGKWLPESKRLDLLAKGLPMPFSVFAQDIWGRDVNAAGPRMAPAIPTVSIWRSMGRRFPCPGCRSRRRRLCCG